MCAPPVLALAATAMATIGTGVGALQAASSARYQARVADLNASMESEAAHNASETGKEEARRLYRKIGSVQGQQIAAQAANGIDPNFGSALQVQEDTATIGSEDVDALYRDTYERVRGFDINASNYRAQAQGSRQAAKGALIKGAFDVAGSILSGASQFSKMKAS